MENVRNGINGAIEKKKQIRYTHNIVLDIFREFNLRWETNNGSRTFQYCYRTLHYYT